MLASFLVSVGNNLELQLGEVEQEVVAIVVVVASDVSCNQLSLPIATTVILIACASLV